MVEGFLLTRHWRDGRDGLELELHWATADGPIVSRVTGVEAVFFIPADALDTARERLADLAGWRARPVELTTRDGEPVAALYFRAQRLAREAEKRLTGAGLPCWEAQVRPPDRYLMERFVTASARLETDEPSGPGATLINPRLTPCDWQPSLTMASIDIETNMGADRLFSIGVVTATERFVLMVADQKGAETTSAGTQVHYCASERACLGAFLKWLEQADPDLLVGWNFVQFDLRVLEKIAARLGMALRLGRGGRRAYWRGERGEGNRQFVTIPGRVALDGIELLKAANHSYTSFALDHVAGELLGEGKLLHGASRGEDITRLFRDDKPALADYNLKDCELVWEIFQRQQLVAFAVARSQLTGLALDRIGGSVAAFEYSYLPRLHRAGFVAPNLGELRSDIVSPGGYVMDSLPGIYRHVLVLDFKSLYPSIIRTFQIDPCAYWSFERGRPGHRVPGYHGAEFVADQAILPAMIERLWQARDRAKREADEPLSYAIKIIMNSFYGVLGSTGCRFFDPRVCSSITLRGHDILQASRRWIEERGYRVIYGDTDSVFVWLESQHPLDDPDRAPAIGAELAAGLNRWWRDRLRAEYGIDSALEIEFETHFEKFLMPTIRGSEEGSKKRYCGQINTARGSELVFKGLEAARSDWTPLAREFQKTLYQRVFDGRDYARLIRETVASLTRGERDGELVYQKRLRRHLDDYLRNVPPHVQAARKARDWFGADYRRGDWVRYVITTAGAEPAEAPRSPLDYEHYILRQLAPVADAILHFLDDSLASVTDRQMTLFG